jgi:DNA-binding MarR family transcriptional regulator
MAVKSTDERCAGEIMETVPLVMRFIRREMRSQGALFLSVPQLRTLVYLDRCPGTDLSSVAEHLGVRPATASVVVNRMVQQNLITREPNPRNRRNVVLTLTRLGSQRLRRVREKACSFVIRALADRPDSELRKIMDGIALLGKVFKDVESSGGRGTFLRR